MPFGGLMALAGPAISGISALSGIFGGSSAQQVQMPPSYQHGNMAGADQGAYGGTGQLGQYNVAAGLLPQYQQIAQGMVNNPYAGGYQGGSNATGAAMQGAGAGIAGTSLGQLPDVQALMSLGFDPQSALYSKLQNQNQQQNAAILGQSGVASTPYGAGVAADANSNFNINWQNQQLQRAIQGAQGAGGLMNNISQNTGTGLGMMGQGAAMPYNTFQGINANALNTLGQTGQFGQSASVLPQQQIQDYLAYLSGGTSQQGANNQTSQVGLNQANSAFAQNQWMGNQLGQSLSGLSSGWNHMNTPNWFSGGGGSGGGIGQMGTG